MSLESISGGADGAGASIEDVGVDHGGLEIGMAEKFLHSSNIVPVLEKVGGKAMAKGVTGDGLR